MMSRLFVTTLLWIVALLSLQCMVAALPSYVPLQGYVGSKRALVLLDDMTRVQTHSVFFENLIEKGYKLSYMQAESSELALKLYGEYLFDDIIIFAPKATDFNTITVQDILAFIGDGGNVLLAVNDEVSDFMRHLAALCGVDFDKRGSRVIDHFASEASADSSLDHTTILASNAVKSKVILGDYMIKSDPVLYRGIGLSVDESNILAVSVLAGNPSTYSSTGKDIIDYPENAGSDVLLVAALQGRNNARVVVSGSIDMFSNAFLRASKGAGNEIFCFELAKWNFGDSGVLRFRDISHNKLDGTPPDVILHEKERPDLPTTLYPDPEITRNSLVYRIRDIIVYSMIVEEFRDEKWVPFYAEDMQMEFVMMDPYVRKTMVADKKTGKFVAEFEAPDNYGVFKFRVLYRRPGYSVIHAETQVSIRPFKHNEYERFILSACPYYFSAFSAMVAFFVFSLFYLYNEK